MKVHGNSSYKPEIGEEILRRLRAGERQRQILKLPGMPTRTTLLHWMRWNVVPDFGDRYYLAQEEGRRINGL